MAPPQSQGTLSVSDAVKIANGQLALLIPGAHNVLLEEVEITDDDRYWLITLGYIPPYQDAPVEKLFTSLGKSPREYKVFKIDRQSGEVRSMKIRERTSD